jgi:CubicO group peptidase (beta-lactamase class C family)
MSEKKIIGMKNFRLSLLLVFFTSLGTAQNLYFPPITGNTWDTISPATLGWCQPPLDSLIDYLGDNETKAFIILKDGKIVVEEYYGSFTQDSLWYWASAGKTLTSFLVGMAQQEGFLSINDTSSQYLGQGWSDCPPAKEEMITIKDHLSMTTGLDDGVPDNYCTLDTCLQYLSDAGTRWAYHNGPYTILDDVISNATGTSLNLYLTQKVKNPTGMNGFFLPSGYNNVYYSNARSMARFGLLMLNQGNWNGNQIMTDQNYFSAMTNTSQSINLSYGYLWWLNGKASYRLPQSQIQFNGKLIPSAPNEVYCALGKNDQKIYIVPSKKLVIIRMGEAADQTNFALTDFDEVLWQKINAVIN